MAIPAIDPHAGERRQDEGRNLTGEANDAEQPGRARQPVDEPTGRHPRQPRSDQRNALPGEEEPIVAMAERSPECSNHRRGRHGSVDHTLSAWLGQVCPRRVPIAGLK